MKTKTLQLRNSANRSHLRIAFLLIPLVWLALSPTAQAVDPPPDGGYPNGNTAEGEDALFRLGEGLRNTAVGFQALYSNAHGADNTAIGYGALHENVGFLNTACGFQALYFNTTGRRNTAYGLNALYANTGGFNNTACGYFALASSTTGFNNIGLGLSAGSANTTGSNNINIGNAGVDGESKTIRLGDSHQIATYIAGISGVTVADGVGVIIGTDGHLGTVVSSARYKDSIKPMDKASEVILGLKPVTFRYKHELDPAGIPQFGLVAEEVEKANPGLVARDKHGKPYTVRYEAVNAMLLNEFLKEHYTVQQQGATITELQKEIADLTATVKEQAGQIQKVSAQLELSKSAPQTVLNDQ
jgi:Chaperone of endosialidase